MYIYHIGIINHYHVIMVRIRMIEEDIYMSCSHEKWHVHVIIYNAYGVCIYIYHMNQTLKQCGIISNLLIKDY